MLHQVRRADKNRAGNKADNQDLSYAMFDPLQSKDPRVFDFAWSTCFEISERPPFLYPKMRVEMIAGRPGSCPAL
jgi:hypothetical protein